MGLISVINLRPKQEKINRNKPKRRLLKECGVPDKVNAAAKGEKNKFPNRKRLNRLRINFFWVKIEIKPNKNNI